MKDPIITKKIRHWDLNGEFLGEGIFKVIIIEKYNFFGNTGRYFFDIIGELSEVRDLLVQKMGREFENKINCFLDNLVDNVM